MPPLSRLLRLGAMAALLATRSFALPSPSVSNLEARACGQVSGYVAVHNATIADQGKWYIDIGANPAFNGAIYRTTDKSEAAHVTFDSCVVGLVSLQCTNCNYGSQYPMIGLANSGDIYSFTATSGGTFLTFVTASAQHGTHDGGSAFYPSGGIAESAIWEWDPADSQLYLNWQGLLGYEFYVYIQDQELFFWGAGQHKTDLYPNLPPDNIPEVYFTFEPSG